MVVAWLLLADSVTVVCDTIEAVGTLGGWTLMLVNTFSL